MKNQLIKRAEQEITELRKKLLQARKRLLIKRKEITKEVNNDALDLFGGRKTDSPDKLFNPQVDPAAISKVLEPFRAEISDYERQLDKWEKDLLRLHEMTETDLFTQSKVA